MRIAAIVCALILAVSVGGHTETYPEKIQKVRAAVVEVLVSGVRSGTGFCAGADGYIITATHVVGTPEVSGNQVVVNYQQNLSVRFSDGRTVAVQPVTNPSAEAGFHDITVLKVDTKTPQFLLLGTPSSIVEGDEVYMMRFPLDVPTAVTYRGNVSALFPIGVGTLNGTPVQNSTIHVQMPVAKGFSGSPLLRMSDNSVVGVVTNKLGGINQKLDEVRQTIRSRQGTGQVVILGVDQSATTLEVINVLDSYLSAGAGWAVSIDYIKPLIEKQKK